MDFIDFARAHGLRINSIKPGVWVRVPTDDHPKKRNGAYKWLGDVGFVQNHATQTDVSVWKPESSDEIRIDPDKVAAIQARIDREVREKREHAAQKAERILRDCKSDVHAYLEAKGFPKERGMVWSIDGKRILVVPIRIGKRLTSLQFISESGEKKFLTGGQTSMGVFRMGDGDPILCEGYATALSIRDACAAARIKRSVIACFSAGNMARVAGGMERAVVVADNDASRTGQRTAEEIGFPFWLSDALGEDFNDTHKRLGLFSVSQSLRKVCLARP